MTRTCSTTTTTPWENAWSASTTLKTPQPQTPKSSVLLHFMLLLPLIPTPHRGTVEPAPLVQPVPMPVVLQVWGSCGPADDLSEHLVDRSRGSFLHTCSHDTQTTTDVVERSPFDAIDRVPVHETRAACKEACTREVSRTEKVCERLKRKKAAVHLCLHSATQKSKAGHVP